MEISITANFAGVQRRLDQLRDDVVKKALPRAINRTLDIAKTAMSKEIRQDFKVSASYVRSRLQVRKASSRNGIYVIEGALVGGDGRKRSANVIAFVEKTITLAAMRKRVKAGEGGRYITRGNQQRTKTLALRYQIKRTGPKRLIKGSFIGNSGRTIFARTGSARLPIKAVSTIDIAQMFNTRRINAAVVRTIESQFPVVFEREAAYATAQFAKATR